MIERSLAGRTILITRAPDQSDEFRNLLEDRGAQVLQVATIEIRPRPSEDIDPAAQQVTGFDWILFTSANAVRIFLGRCRERGSLSYLQGAVHPRICTVGPSTKATVEDFGLKVDLLPENFRGEGVLDVLQNEAGDLRGRKFLFPAAAKARAILPDGLRKMGVDLTVLPVYDTVPPREAAARLRSLLSRGEPDLVAVTSSSTARNFVSLCAPDLDPQRFAFAAIGPVTGETCRRLGLNLVVEAGVSTIPGLVEAITDYFTA